MVVVMGPGPFWMMSLTLLNELTAPGLEDYVQQRLAVPASRHKQIAYYIGANVIKMALKKQSALVSLCSLETAVNHLL